MITAPQQARYRPAGRPRISSRSQTEAVLRHRLGVTAVMAEQLRHLADLCSLPMVSLRVIPVDTDMPSRYGPSFDLFERSDGGGTVVVELEGGEFREDRDDQLARYRLRFDVYRRAALEPAASRTVIEDLAARMRAAVFRD